MEAKKDFKNYYEILGLVGVGSFGKVYKVRHKASKELRAAKKIDIDEENDNKLKFIRNEINIRKLIQAKSKDNTVKFYEYFKNKDEIIIVMELCDCNLDFFLRNIKNGLKPGEILEILTQLNNTFKILYENKIVHRVLNLYNILLKFENEEKTKYKVKLSGYSLSEQLINLEYLSEYVGTPLYMAPEILEGKEYNQKCDLWSLGIIIYLLYFKDYPYKSMTEVAILNSIKKIGKKCIKQTGNKDLDDLISKLLEQDPKKRITWKDYFEHPFFKNNSNDFSENKKDNEK